MADCCNNVCEVDVIDEQQRRTLILVLVINALMFVVVLIAALIAKSSSLLSGSIDNLGDAITYGLSLYAVSRGNDVKARVSLIKGLLIFFAALAVTGQVIYKIINPAVPIFELMGLMTIISLGANFLCLGLLTKHRNQDINMASVWECSRNDVIENVTVLLAAIGVWLTDSQWPDIFIALILILILYRSAFRIIRLSIIEINRSKTV
jgi:Co/Zn/Cd efflux system component